MVQLATEKYFPSVWVVHFIFGIHVIAFIESYYFLCVKKTIGKIYRKMCLLIRKLILRAYLMVKLYYFIINSQSEANMFFLLLPSNQERSKQLG